MDIREMTKEDFESIEYCKWNENTEIAINSIIIIPTNEMHDSGWMTMDFIAVNNNNEPLFRFGGCSDVLHLDGIGGYGKWDPKDSLPMEIKPKSWSIDCLPCGYLRLFSRYPITKGWCCSDMEIFAEVV